jgi:hypothetical protein
MLEEVAVARLEGECPEEVDEGQLVERMGACGLAALSVGSGPAPLFSTPLASGLFSRL